MNKKITSKILLSVSKMSERSMCYCLMCAIDRVESEEDTEQDRELIFSAAVHTEINVNINDICHKFDAPIEFTYCINFYVFKKEYDDEEKMEEREVEEMVNITCWVTYKTYNVHQREEFQTYEIHKIDAPASKVNDARKEHGFPLVE